MGLMSTDAMPVYLSVIIVVVKVPTESGRAVIVARHEP